MNEIELAPDLLSVVVAKTLAEEHVADIVEMLDEQDSATIAHILQEMPFERAVEVLDQPELADAAASLATLISVRC